MEFGIPSLWRRISDFRQVSIRTFHLAWTGFFLCLMAWMGIVPVLSVVRRDMGLSDNQVALVLAGTLVVASIARPLAGWLCDIFGPRRTYGWILIAGSVPVIASAFSWNFESFFLSRALVGCVGGAFVGTVYHTTMMFGPGVVGQANATTTGWGNLGASSIQMVMPFILVGLVAIGMPEMAGWRVAMVVVAKLMIINGIFYLAFTRDTPEGDFKELRKMKLLPLRSEVGPAWRRAIKDHRIWVLFVIYAACVGLEITVISFGSFYFIEVFNLDSVRSGIVIGSFGLMNIFARSFGGYLGDFFGSVFGLTARSYLLFACLVLEGLMLVLFSQEHVFVRALVFLLSFSLFTQMAEGATYAVTPFLKRATVGASSGIVGAGGTLGALAGTLIIKEITCWSDAFLALGAGVMGISCLAFLVRFSTGEENTERAIVAQSCLEGMEAKLNKVRARSKVWRARAETWKGPAGRYAHVWSGFLKQRLMRLEDIVDEGRAGRNEVSQVKRERPMLRVVWNASAEG